jgi:hypothetical protein
VAKARWGAAGQNSHAHATCRNMLSARRPVHSNTKRVPVTAHQDASRRGQVLRALGCTPPCHAAQKEARPSDEHRQEVVGAGLTLALGCAVTATASSLPHKPTRRKGQTTGHKARHAHGAKHGGAAWGSPWSSQQNSNVASR